MATRSENQAYFDAQIRRRIRERRTTAGVVAAILKLLEEADQKLAAYLRIELAGIAGRPLATVNDRLTRIMAQVSARRRETLIAIRKEIRARMAEIAAQQPDAESKLLVEALGAIEEKIQAVDRGELRRSVIATPFSVREDRSGTLAELLLVAQRAETAAIRQAILSGIAAGDNLDGIMQRIAGSRDRQFSDGAMATARRGVAAITEGAVLHSFETGTAAFWALNAAGFGVVLRWTTMLDDGVCPICRARGGKFTNPSGGPLPPNTQALHPTTVRPPAHLRCRCTMVAFFAGEIPDEPSYADWFRTQSAATQDEILGPKRGALYRSGKATLDSFVDRRGRELTLEQLKGM